MAHIWVDADATPRRIKELLIKAVQRRQVEITFVANKWLQLPRHPKIKMCVVSAGLDKADDLIAENTQAGDLIITADVPLAERCVDKGGPVVTPRGHLMNRENIAQKRSIRDLNEEFRNAGMLTGGPTALSSKDIQRCANGLDRWIQSCFKK